MKNKINCLQYNTMLIIIMVSSFMGIGIYSLVRAAGIDAYITILLGVIVGIPALLLFLYIASYEPDLSFPQKMEKLYGQKIGKVVSIISAIFIFIFANNYMFNLINFIVSQFLPETPLMIVGIIFAILMIYTNHKGLETISRVSLVLLSINIILFAIGFIGLIPSIDTDNLKPFLEFGIGRPLQATFYYFTLMVMPMFALLIVPKNKVTKPEKFNRSFVFGYLFSSLFIFGFCIITLGILGIHLASIYQYPEYIILKHVNLFGFLDRIENIVTAQWIFGLFFSVTFAVYYVGNCIKPEHNSKMLPTSIVTLMLLASVYLIPNNTAFNNYIYFIAPILRVFSFSLFVIIGISIFIKKKFKRKS